MEGIANTGNESKKSQMEASESGFGDWMKVVKGRQRPVRPPNKGAIDVVGKITAPSKNADNSRSGQAVGANHNCSSQNSKLVLGGIGTIGSRYHVLAREVEEDHSEATDSIDKEVYMNGLEEDMAMMGKGKLKEGGVAAGAAPMVVASDPLLFNNIRPVNIVQRKWANTPKLGPRKALRDITNQQQVIGDWVTYNPMTVEALENNGVNPSKN